jgi:hypothetical protein
MALVAASMELEDHLPVAYYSLMHRAAAVQLMRKRLQQSSGVPDDTIVGAGAILLIVAVSSVNVAPSSFLSVS